VRWLYTRERNNYPFTLSVDQTRSGFLLTVQAPPTPGAERVCSLAETAIAEVARALKSRPETPFNRIPAISDPERIQVAVEWNRTEAEYPKDRCVHELFEAQAAATPHATAVIYHARALTYLALNSRANRLARYLRGFGVEPGSRVALCMERSPDIVVSLLAVLKAGGAYVPVDPSYPAERLRFMLEDSSPVVVLTDEESEPYLSEMSGKRPLTIDVRNDSPHWDTLSANNLPTQETGVSPDHLAYLIYTSGSTGRPKRVMVHHQALCNYVTWARGAYNPVSGSTVSSSLSFDATVTSIYTPLLCGGAVRLVSPGGQIEELAEKIEQENPGLLKITPSHLDAMGTKMAGRQSHGSVSLFVIGGERLSSATIQTWRTLQPQARFVNEYGPTETTVGCATYEAADHTDSPAVPIGRPIANTRIYILDERGEPVPVGVPGEIYIGGAGVAKGSDLSAWERVYRGSRAPPLG
jgi:amino acid adenylation domain-containing protein